MWGIKAFSFYILFGALVGLFGIFMDVNFFSFVSSLMICYDYRYFDIWPDVCCFIYLCYYAGSSILYKSQNSKQLGHPLFKKKVVEKFLIVHLMFDEFKHSF